MKNKSGWPTDFAIWLSMLIVLAMVNIGASAVVALMFSVIMRALFISDGFWSVFWMAFWTLYVMLGFFVGKMICNREINIDD